MLQTVFIIAALLVLLLLIIAAVFMLDDLVLDKHFTKKLRRKLGVD
jgi:hypothetical protein